jgi:Reverse transcriptase (RNA-dependent DNA polymerase)
VATVWTVPGYSNYCTFCAQATVDGINADEIMAMDSTIAAMIKDDDPVPLESTELPITEIGDSEIFSTNSSASSMFQLEGPPTRDDIDSQQQDNDEAVHASSELLRIHQKFSHISMQRLQNMAKIGLLPIKLSTCRVPLCQACLYGKLTRKPWRHRAAGSISRISKSTRPGEMVSVDQLESSVPGLVGQLKGKITRIRYRVTTVFVDHYSGLSFVHLQSSTNAKETIEAKLEFERYARSYGVQIKHYHADSGRFSDNAWRADIIDKGQHLTFCGASAHHQNGVAEKRIRDLQDLARTSLIHANRRWPWAIDSHLWPYALRHANECFNRTPTKGHAESPVEMFSGVKVRPNLQDVHPFACPAYALDGNLQNSNKINKWASRSRLAIYLGYSLQHSRSVGLVLSLRTGLVSPQFHVKYDDSFDTVRRDQQIIMPTSEWQVKCGFRDDNNSSDNNIEVAKSENGVIPGIHNAEHSTSINANIDRDVTGNSPIYPVINIPPIPHIDSNSSESGQQPANILPTNNRQVPPTHDAPATTRSGRVVRTPSRYSDYVAYERTVVQDCLESSTEYLDPMAYASSADPDVMHLHEAMKQPDKKEFINAMKQEIQAHTDSNNWKLVKRSTVPKEHSVLPAIWAMRRKRRIDTQEIYKWKARINVHGGRQVKGLNYSETYTPVASWSSIRLVMMFAALKNWRTKQLDFVLAFPQAPVETDLYMEIPKGFEVPNKQRDYVLKLINNLYGQKQAGRIWNKFLVKGLQELGFQQSKVDYCVLWRQSVMLVIYTDDTIVTGPSDKLIDQAINDIGRNFEITHSPSVSDFLGVKICREGSQVSLSQPQLIASILKDLGLEGQSNSRSIPALSSVILHKYENSENHHEKWDYRSVIGKLNYLEKSTRPDLAYAVPQCARFAANPKVEHTKAVKLIGRYLLGTANKGMICIPKKESFHAYCDADFAGN